MTSVPFSFDMKLFELLQHGQYETFTIRELRDRYADTPYAADQSPKQLWRFIYEQIRRMVKIGWVVQDDDRRKRDQRFHLRPIPQGVKMELFDNYLERRFTNSNGVTALGKPDEDHYMSSIIAADATVQLEDILKEVRLDFLASMGEAERFKQLFEAFPSVRERMECDYIEARDKSSRLLGHLRAIEKTLKVIVNQ